MSQPSSQQPPAAGKTAATPPTPEAEANQRIADLQTRLKALQQEVISMEGKVLNRDPVKIEALKKENEALGKSFILLKKSVFVIISESHQPRIMDELKLQYEILRRATIEYCTKAKIDPELWKSIAS